MKLAFMSSVCPKLTLTELLQKAADAGYAGLEFRPEWNHRHGLETDMAPGARRDAANRLADSGIVACCISPGTKFVSPDEQERNRMLERLKSFVDLARDLGIPLVRHFCDTIPNGGNGARARSYAVQTECLLQAADYARSADVRLSVETHGNFRAVDAGEILFRAAYHPALTLNWHLEHCLRHGEDVDEAYRHVKGRVSHCHFNMEGDRAHIRRQLELLAGEGFEGFFSVEVINPEDPDGVLDTCKREWTALCAELGI